MCNSSCDICGGWNSKCPGTHGVINKLEEKVALEKKRIKWLREQLKEYDIKLLGKKPSNWEIKKVDIDE